MQSNIPWPSIILLLISITYIIGCFAYDYLNNEHI